MLDTKLMKKLSEADGLACNETEIRKILNKEMSKFSDDVYTDNLGSIIFEHKGSANAPKIMIAAHMDEVGFRVKSITENGHLMLKPIGGVKNLAKFMQGVRITTKNGDKIKGFMQSTYTEEEDAKNIPGKTFVDLGLYSKKEVEKLGISVGDTVTFDSNFSLNKDTATMMGKALDDRLGCYIIAKVIEKLHKKKCSNNLYFCGTASEEKGTGGAETCPDIIDPDIAIVVDTCCYKEPFAFDCQNNRQIGKGLIINHSERGMEPNQTLLEMVLKCAAKLKKNVQNDVFVGGGTDATDIHLHHAGVPTVTLCIPLRYGHCAYSFASTKDVEDTIEILCEFLSAFNNKMLKSCLTFI